MGNERCETLAPSLDLAGLFQEDADVRALMIKKFDEAAAVLMQRLPDSVRSNTALFPYNDSSLMLELQMLWSTGGRSSEKPWIILHENMKFDFGFQDFQTAERVLREWKAAWAGIVDIEIAVNLEGLSPNKVNISYRFILPPAKSLKLEASARDGPIAQHTDVGRILTKDVLRSHDKTS